MLAVPMRGSIWWTALAGEDVMRRLPVGVLVGIAEARHPERCRVREGLAKVSRGRTGADRLLERVNDPGRIVTEQLLSKCGVARPVTRAASGSEQVREFAG